MVLHFQNHLTLTLWYSYKSNTYFYANPEHPGYRGITQRQIGGDAFQEQFCIVLVFFTHIWYNGLFFYKEFTSATHIAL